MTEASPALVVLAAGMAKRFGGGCKPLAPLGLHGEAVIDLTTGDALAAGFGRVVLVLGPQTGPAIEYHVARNWPAAVDVAFAYQPVPLGTTHAVLCARDEVGDGSFAVVNADDVYGPAAFETLAAHLAGANDEHALVGFRLGDTVVTDEPVTRGTCTTSGDGHLVQLVERRLISRRPDGTFHAGDGRAPAELDADTPVSMNLWGLRPTLWPTFEAAVRAVHPAVDRRGHLPADQTTSSEEVLLPEVIGTVVATSGAAAVRVLPGTGRCVGVTHAEDLPAARDELAELVANGLRPEVAWAGVA